MCVSTYFWLSCVSGSHEDTLTIMKPWGPKCCCLGFLWDFSVSLNENLVTLRGNLGAEYVLQSPASCWFTAGVGGGYSPGLRALDKDRWQSVVKGSLVCLPGPSPSWPQCVWWSHGLLTYRQTFLLCSGKRAPWCLLGGLILGEILSAGGVYPCSLLCAECSGLVGLFKKLSVCPFGIRGNMRVTSSRGKLSV